MLKRLRFTLACLSVIACLSSLSPPAASAEAGGPGDYVMIRFIGDFSGQVSFPDGRTEYITSMIAGMPKPPSHTDRRMYQITLLLNLLAKQGYEYASTDGQDRENVQIIVLKKVR